MSSRYPEAPDIREGDTVVFTRGEEPTEATVSKVYEDGSFCLEWRDWRGKRGQMFKPTLFTRDGRGVEHVPGPRHEQTTLEGVA